MCYEGVALDRSCSPGNERFNSKFYQHLKNFNLSGLYFSRGEHRCVRRAESDCLLDDGSCPAVNDPNNIVFLPDQEDCQR